MREEIIIALLCAFGFTWCAVQAADSDVRNGRTSTLEAPSGAIGEAMRRRNDDARKACTGTVAQRRACWLEFQLTQGD
jgi:hypothetical protein